MNYDVLIIGSGVAGLGAAIYAQRFDLKTLVIGDLPGGTITKTHLVENYPGFTSLTGMELGNNIAEHAKATGAELKMGSVKTAEQIDGGFKIVTGTDEEITAKAVIIATGTEHRKLGAPGEEEFNNKGVSYCATCDGPFFRGKDTVIIGGSDSAVKESLVLAEHASSVKIIYRKDKLRAEPINIRRMEAKDNIEVIYNANVVEITGEQMVTGVKLDTGDELAVGGVFVEIGRLPRAEVGKQLGCEIDEKTGEIVTDRYSKTNVPGVFAAGDVTNTDWKQAITGVAEGAHAANQAFEYISS